MNHSHRRIQTALKGLAIAALALGISAQAHAAEPTLKYDFSISGTLAEAGSAAESSGTYLWLASGGKLLIANGAGSTLQGSLGANDPLRKAYAANATIASDNGFHPQNLFELLTKQTWTNASTKVYATIKQDNAFNTENIKSTNGIFVIARAQSKDLFYEGGVTMDGTAVIKKKYPGGEYTYASAKAWNGSFDPVSNPDILPHGKPIGIRLDVSTDAAGTVVLKLYLDKYNSGSWTLALSGTDTLEQLAAGSSGIKTDFIDAAFDNFVISPISNQSKTPTPAPAPVLAPTPTVSGTAQTPAPSGAGALGSLALYVIPNSNAKLQADAWRSSRPADAAAMDKIAGEPVAAWFGEWSGDIKSAVANTVSAAAAQNQAPVLVAYNIPSRDCGSYSAGGSNDPASYRSWIQNFAAGIGSRKAVVILEPDAIAGIDCLSASQQNDRYGLLQFAVSTLKQNAGTTVYVDAGHSAWLSSDEAARRLTLAGISQADGFSLNVSNFQPTSNNASYGAAISAKVGGKHFVIDTSRNGAGPGGDWCNPSGRALGEQPTTKTGNALIDAYLWVKPPGESDGSCNGGPSAGVWWPDYALGLASRAAY